MNKKRSLKLLSGIILIGGALAFILTGCQSQSPAQTEQEKESTKAIAQENLAETQITGNGNAVSITGNGAAAEEGIVTISSAGSYRLSGNIEEGQIRIDAGKDDEIQLILDGFTIKNSTSSPIYGLQSSLITISLEEGTHNTISDGKSYVYSAEGEDEPNAAIFSKDDLILEGTGALVVNGNYDDGIRGKDDVTFKSGTYTIQAVNDGIKGKDSVTIENGSFTITAGGDGIQSNNSEDADKGTVTIADGTISIAAGKKGIIAESMLALQGGILEITAEDDSVHSNGNIHIAGGAYTLSTKDDAIHADNQVLIDDGTITIPDSYEGIEGFCIDINGGTIALTASDDGLNSAGGNDSSGNTSKWGDDPFAVAEGAYIRITGGSVKIMASGDGIDSNGDLFMEGGSVYVEGPVNNGNGALDYNGTAEISEGVLVATGSSGMFQALSETSSQPFIVIYYTETKSAGTEIQLADKEGNQLLSVTPAKDFTALLISSPELKDKEAYTITAGEELTELTLNGISNQSGTSGRGMGGVGGRGMGGNGGDRTGDRSAESGDPENRRGGRREGQVPPENGNPPEKRNLPEGESLPKEITAKEIPE